MSEFALPPLPPLTTNVNIIQPSQPPSPLAADIISEQPQTTLRVLNTDTQPDDNSS